MLQGWMHRLICHFCHVLAVVFFIKQRYPLHKNGYCLMYKLAQSPSFPGLLHQHSRVNAILQV